MLEILSGVGAAESLGITRARLSQLTDEGKITPVRNERGGVVGYMPDAVELLRERRKCVKRGRPRKVKAPTT